MNNEKELRHRYGWTPAPTKPMYSQTNVSLAHKGRDYDAILRAAKRRPVGYWEDAPTGIKFGSGDTRSVNPPLRANAGSTPAAPTTPPPPQQSADGLWPKWKLDAAAQLRGKAADDGLYEPVGTLPVVGDECDCVGYRFRAVEIGAVGCRGDCWSCDLSCFSERGNSLGVTARILKRKPTVQTVAARAWADEGFAWVQIGGVLYSRVPDGQFVQSVSGRTSYMKSEWEKFGPERDAIVAECRKAMGL